MTGVRAGRSVTVGVEGIRRPPGLGRLSGFCSRALRAAGFSSWNVAVLLCGDERMRDLNERYRGLPRPTDVLSFPREQERREGPVAGDIAISVETLARNALRFGVSENDEMKRLLVHGLLHLAGMDHGRGKGRAMLVRQARILDGLRPDVIYGENEK